MREKTKLQIIREQRGISITELRNLTQIPRTTYYRYEQQQRLPDVLTAIKIADALGVENLRELWECKKG